jgi:hypothetical protein
MIVFADFLQNGEFRGIARYNFLCSSTQASHNAVVHLTHCVSFRLRDYSCCAPATSSNCGFW